MLTIGLAGGIASGKSFVAEQFAHLGAQLLNADQVGHEVLREPKVIEQIVQWLGNDVLAEDGQLNRKRIAELVFGEDSESQQRLSQLEEITHPRIAEIIQRQMAEYREQNLPATVLDAPVMFKSGWDAFCDKIVFVDTRIEIRLARALDRGWTPEQFEARESAQLPIEVKRQRATDVIDNNGESANTKLQATQLWVSWDLPLPKNYEVPAEA